MSTKSTSTEEGEPPERSAGFVLYTCGKEGERRYLLLRHRNGGHWGFPKGRIEAGEPAGGAALREAKEETGIKKVEVIPGFCTVSTYRFLRDGAPVRKKVIYFLARAEPGDIVLSDEHVAWRWLPYPAAYRTLTYPDTQKVLRAAERFLLTRAADGMATFLQRC